MDSTENESKSEAESLVEASASSNSRGFGAGLLSWIGGGGSSENTSNSAKNAAAPSITEEKGISESLSKLLTDKSYDKRKSGAVQVQLTMRRRWAAEKNHNLVRIVLDQLKHDFIESIYANHRKGGLISLAAISLALRESAPIFMEDIIPPVLLLLKDHDFSVRYYASEALFNIGTHIRSPILKYFNCIYDGICMLYADVDADVRNGASVLDKLLRDIVTISCSTDPSLLNISTLIPILCERLPIKISSVRVFNISWILLLDTLPNLGLVKYLPQFLHSLLLMLSDSSKEVRQKADACLSYFLHKAIEQAEFPSDWLTNCMNILILECQPTTISFCRNEGEDHADKFVLGRLTALTWINELAQVTRFQVFPELIDVALICLEDSDTSIKSKSRELNFNLHGIIGKYSSHCVSGKEDVGVRSFLEVVESHLQSKNPVIRIAAVEWIISLIRTWTNEMSNETQLLLYLSNLTLTLMDESDEVCELSVRALSMIALVDEHRFHLIFEHLFLAFCKDRRLLQQRSRAIILMLVKAIDALRVYKVLSHLIASAEEKYFESATLLVQTLNTLLLTSAELKRMKNELYDSFTEAPETFYFLYKAWCFDPISSVCICIVFRLYELGGELISQFENVDITVSFMIQAKLFVEILEMSDFPDVQLMEPLRNPHLLKILYGLLMILPQNSTFEILRRRLEKGTMMNFLSHTDYNCGIPLFKAIPESSHQPVDVAELVDIFVAVQKRYKLARLRVLRNASLIPFKKKPVDH